MKFRKLPRFDADWARLSDDEKRAFKKFVKDKFVPACDAYARSPQNFRWPRSLRVEKVTGYDALAVTWSFAGPDGRATFNIETVGDELMLVWRRVSRHDVYDEP